MTGGAMLSTADAAERIGMTPVWVAQQCHAGNLRAVKLGRSWRIDPADLADFLAPHNRVASVRTRRRARRRRPNP